MTRRARIPEPFQRLLPSITRPFGPRVVLIAGACAALLLVGGSGYILSQITETPIATPQTTPATQQRTDAQSNAAVLGASTTGQPASDDTNGGTAAAGNTSATTGVREPSPPFISTAPAAITIQPSFSIVVDTAAIQHSPLGTVYIPFTVVRQGGLSTSIVPGDVQITAGGKLSDLITVQSAVMLGQDNGAITLLPVGLFPRDISVTFFANSGSATASTSFSYHIGL